jgi:hypothetical protein
LADVAAGAVLETTPANEQSLAGRGFADFAASEDALANAPEKSTAIIPSRSISITEILLLSDVS